MNDLKERLAARMKEYESGRDAMMRRAMLFMGGRLKKMNNPVGRFFIAHVSTRLLAWAIVRFGLFGVEKKENMSLEEMALNWMKLSLFFNIPTELGEVTEDRVIVLRPECTVGFEGPQHCGLCRASMNMDRRIMRKLGGKLTVTETILEGAPMCRHVLEKA